MTGITMRSRLRALGAIAALPLAGIPLAAVTRAALAAGDPAPDLRVAQLETAFLMGMIPHHRGAVMMSEMALKKSPKAELKTFALKIIGDQMEEIEKMSHFLRDWYVKEPPAGEMMPMDMMMPMPMPMPMDMPMPVPMPTGMSMPMDMSMMPDMAGRMKTLEAKSGADFDIEFLSAMTDHHAMALMMAAHVLINAHHADLYTLAENMVISQGQEIKQMDEWLDAWYGVKRPV